ncbi:Deoxyguanosinetriphosphate triphosphohydrolase [Cronobacter sakazakii]|nr:Deoxyguanosinetriphosphate triphosphohydrolase [Cronobacter sakazakii]
MQTLRLQEGEEALNALRGNVRRDLCHFEGNAQGIRLVHTLLRMNLTWAQVGGILKYTRPAWPPRPGAGNPQLPDEKAGVLSLRRSIYFAVA